MDMVGIRDAAWLLNRTSDKVSTLVTAVKQPISPLCMDMLLDELKHVQLLAIELTNLITDAEHSDEGVFAEGELTSAKNKEEE